LIEKGQFVPFLVFDWLSPSRMWPLKASEQIEVTARGQTFEVSSNQFAVQLLVMNADNMPIVIAVETPITERPPHRSQRAQFTH
jgi:hypothetical protein